MTNYFYWNVKNVSWEIWHTPTFLERFKCRSKSGNNGRSWGTLCCNPSLGLVTKAKVCKGAGQEWSLGVTFHAPGSIGKCERMYPHTPRWFTLGIGFMVDFWIFKTQLQGLKIIGLKCSLHHWKTLRTQMSKMGLHDPFGHLKHMLWPEEGPGVKLAIWLPTTKSQESPWFPCMRVACNISLQSSQQRLKLCFRTHFNQRIAHKVMGLQSCKSPNLGNFKTPTWES
jgi:hypothetical protein